MNYPLNSEYIESIKSTENFTKILNMSSKTSPYIVIYNIVKEDYYDFNFETFIAILEYVLDYRLSQFREGPTSTSWKSLSSVIFKLKDDISQGDCFKDQQCSYNVLTYYIDLLNSKVQVYDDICKCKEEANLFLSYIKKIENCFDAIKIYSTNYDMLVPRILKVQQVYLSLDNDIIPSFIYDINKFISCKLTYFPLHGCSYIEKEKLGKYRLGLIPKSISLYSSSNEGGNPNTETFFTPIISGYNKLEHLNGKPFNFGFHAFTNDIFDSEEIITMGYSYNDPHINSLLETFSNCPIKCVTLNDSPNFTYNISCRVNIDKSGIKNYINNKLQYFV